MASDIVVPYEKVPAETLNALIESYVLRSGTDYGVEEASLLSRVAQVRRQLEKREVVLVFDAESDTCTLITASAHRNAHRSPSPPECPPHSNSGDLG